MITVLILTLVGAVVAAVLGTLWYSSATPMGRVHIRYLGFDKFSDEEKRARMETGKKMMPKMYTAQMVLSLLMSFSVVFVVTESIHNGLPFILGAGFAVMNWFCFAVPVVGTNVLWSNLEAKLAWQKFFSDSFYFLVFVLIMAALAGYFA